LLGCLALSAIVWGSAIQGQLEDHPDLFWVDLVVGTACYVLVFWRRRFPLTVALVTAVAGMYSGLAAGPGTLAAVSLATRRNLPQILLVGVVNVITAQGFVRVQPVVSEDPPWLNVAINTALMAALLAIGMYIGSRRELMWTLRERALRAETEQALRVGQARATERERIAREMHDVLGHRISLVTMHAGALTFRDDLSRADVAASARIIQDNAHQAMVELRGILGVLRGADDSAPDRPQPTLSDVPALVDEARASGTPVDLTVQVPDPLPERLGRTVYRVVQEGLTNTRKHAGAARVAVHVSGGRTDGVTVRIENPLPPGSPPAGAPGYGLVGLTERAELAGGTLRWDVRDRRFVLEVWLPWPG
jgi:signal transduction histidine kinase